MNTASWGKQLQDLIFEKLGLCRRCISIAIIGTLVGWVLFILLALVFNNPILTGLISIIAIGFTFVLLAHLVAYFFRVYIPLNIALRNLEVIRADLSIS